MAIKYLSKTGPGKLKGVALVRLDFNTEDAWRMDAALPTLRILTRHALAVVVLSHRGRPEGQDKKLSLRKYAEQLAVKINRPVSFLKDFDFGKIKENISLSPRGSVFLLENIRFLKGENGADDALARQLAGLGDYYVNDAFPVDHRAGSSISAVDKYMPSYAGLQLEKEISKLSAVMKSPARPLVLIIGGAKASDKMEVLNYFFPKSDAILFGGAAASTLLKARGVGVGASLIDTKADPKFLSKLNKSKKVVLPIDWAKEKDAIYDIGPQTEELFAEKIKSARTIIWSGPMGRIENPKFALGNLAVAKAIAANRKAFSLTGGGETVSFLKKHKLDKKFSFISTGGGAMLEYLAGKKLPGITALEKNKTRP